MIFALQITRYQNTTKVAIMSNLLGWLLSSNYWNSSGLRTNVLSSNIIRMFSVWTVETCILFLGLGFPVRAMLLGIIV